MGWGCWLCARTTRTRTLVSPAGTWSPLSLGGCLVGCTLSRTVLGLLLRGRNTEEDLGFVSSQHENFRARVFYGKQHGQKQFGSLVLRQSLGGPRTHKRVACLVGTAIKRGGSSFRQKQGLWTRVTFLIKNLWPLVRCDQGDSATDVKTDTLDNGLLGLKSCD